MASAPYTPYTAGWISRRPYLSVEQSTTALKVSSESLLWRGRHHALASATPDGGCPHRRGLRDQATPRLGVSRNR